MISVESKFAYQGRLKISKHTLWTKKLPLLLKIFDILFSLKIMFLKLTSSECESSVFTGSFKSKRKTPSPPKKKQTLKNKD